MYDVLSFSICPLNVDTASHTSWRHQTVHGVRCTGRREWPTTLFSLQVHASDNPAFFTWTIANVNRALGKLCKHALSDIVCEQMYCSGEKKHLCPCDDSCLARLSNSMSVWTLSWNKLITKFRGISGFLRRFRDPIRVPRIREIGSLQINTGFLTFSLKKTWVY